MLLCSVTNLIFALAMRMIASLCSADSTAGLRLSSLQMRTQSAFAGRWKSGRNIKHV